jgi:phosphoglycolate phosphatase-like HAD superfamily hydrolase
MSLPPIIITDLDNTLYNWVDFFAPSFRGMVHALSKETDFPEEMIRDGMRKVFKVRGSLEYPVRAEDMAFLKGRSKSEIQDLNHLMFGAFTRCRRKNLKLYDRVPEFLEWIRARQITLVAVTNAPSSGTFGGSWGESILLRDCRAGMVQRDERKCKFWISTNLV